MWRTPQQPHRSSDCMAWRCHRADSGAMIVLEGRFGFLPCRVGDLRAPDEPICPRHSEIT